MSYLPPTTSDFRANGFQTIVPGKSQPVSISGSSVQSVAFEKDVSCVVLYATATCFIKIGANPTALDDGSCMIVPAGFYIGVGIYTTNQQSSVYKLAVIQNSGAGTLYITEAK